MNQKGSANILLIAIIVILVVAVGYFALVRKSETPPVITSLSDGTAVKEVVAGFLGAKQSRNFENAKPFLSSEFTKTIDPIRFAGTSNPHTGRFEIQDIKLLPDGKTYEVNARVYQEYTGEGDIGYNDNQYYVRLFENNYLIDDVKYGEYVELPPSLPTTCKDESEGMPIITSLSAYSGPIGTKLEIRGCNFSGFEGDKNAWIENGQGVNGLLYGEAGSNSKILKVTLKSPLCQKDTSYSGLSCDTWFTLTSGTYKIYTMPWGKKSNEVTFTIK